MFSRSRSLLVLSLNATVVATALLLGTGCGSKKKPEVRLAQTTTDDASASGMAGKSGTGGSSWTPGGAPGEADGFGSGTNVAGAGRSGKGLGGDMGGSSANALTKDGTGSLANNGDMSGIEGAMLSGELGMVHFAFDSYEITPDWQKVLDGHADWLKGHPNVNVQVEGHTDERGTEEYNISLGQRRADAVREYLIGKGIPQERLSTISYGKMRPLDAAGSEQAMSMNRRAMFLVFEKQVASAN